LQALLAEIRLTIAAASNQLGGRKIESIVLCGQQPYQDLARAIEAELEIRVELFDPFGGVKLGRALVESPPEHPGRFAPLVGMLLAELKPSSHAVDFLHPRRRAEAADPRKKWMIAGAVAAVLLLGWIVYSRIDHYLLASSVDQLTQQLKGMDDSMAHANKVLANTGGIANWVDNNVIWLDRIYALNQSLPSAEDVALGELTFNSPPRGGRIEVKGWVRQSAVIGRLEEAIRAHGDEISAKSSRQDGSVQPYSVYFDDSVSSTKGEKP
jgi:hypothetical protein